MPRGQLTKVDVESKIEQKKDISEEKKSKTPKEELKTEKK